MLDTITIKNFKAIGDEGLTLSGLASVNYLVGPNGCGKSSVLECLQLFSLPYRLLSGNPNNTIPTDFISKEFKKTWLESLPAYKEYFRFFGINTTNNTLLNLDKPDTDKLYQNDNHLKENRTKLGKLLKITFRKNDLLNRDITNCTKVSEIQNHKANLALFNEVYYHEITIYPSVILPHTNLLLEKFESFIKKEGLKKYYKHPSIMKDSIIALNDNSADGFKYLFEFQTLLQILKNENYSTVLIEEPETNLHPQWQKLIPKILNEFKTDFPNTQFIISTHSPSIIRSALNFDDQNIYHLKDGVYKTMLNKEKIRAGGVLSFDQAISDLGFEMKDIYYPNCLIYVEGPVDIMYMDYWLQKYIEEDNKKKLLKGLDYSFVEYGGALAAHLELDPTFTGTTISDKEFTRKLVNVFSLNRKVFFITDSDTSLDKNGKPKRAFGPTKTRIEVKIKELKDSEYRVEFYKEENPKIDTIEKYLKRRAKYSKSKSKINKVPPAIFNLSKWYEDKIGLDKFEPECRKLIEKIYDFIIR